MNDTTAIIITKGNPPHFWEMMQSIEPLATEILIGAICIDHQLYHRLKGNPKVRIIPLSSDIPFADIVKEDLKKQATGKYILYLDPDEIFPKEALRVLEKRIDEFDYFCFPRRNIIFHKPIRHSRWWPDYQLRFFKKNMVVWPKKIHPEPDARGRGFMLPAEDRFAILHYNYDTIDQYFEKAVRYAKAEARSYVIKNTPITLPDTIRKAVGEFISRFFACEGYKDGIHGYILGAMQTFYYFMVYMYYWEIKKYSERVDEKTIITAARDFFKLGAMETGYWVRQKELAGPVEKLKIRIVVKLMKIFKL